MADHMMANVGATHPTSGEPERLGDIIARVMRSPEAARDAMRLAADGDDDGADVIALVRALRDVCTYRVRHVCDGYCPDDDANDARDPDCAACGVLMRADALLERSKP